MTSGVKTVIKELRVEHYNGNVLGINTNKPRISWRYSSGVNEDDSVQLEFYRSMPGDPGKKLLITTDINNNILYKWPLEKLRDREMVAVRARIVTVKEQKSQWSEPLKFDVGILDKYELLSRFIGPSWFEGTTDHRRLPVIRKKFLLKGDIVHARLYVSALG